MAGWAKAPNLLKFLLLSSACAAATGHALGIDRRPKIVSHMNRQLVSCQTICDQEVEGEENLEVFKSFWGEQHIPKAKLARFGIDMTTESVEVTTDLLEPTLLMADYAAGLGLAYVLDQVGTLRLPLSQDRSKEHLLKLNRKSKLVIQEEDFEFSCKEIFSEVMDRARELADG